MLGIGQNLFLHLWKFSIFLLALVLEYCTPPNISNTKVSPFYIVVVFNFRNLRKTSWTGVDALLTKYVSMNLQGAIFANLTSL